jgi:hypothetical protein
MEAINYLKKAYSGIKTWFVKNGITGIAGLIAGVLLFILGYKFYAGIAFGVFATRNWDIIVDYVSDLLNSGDSSEDTDEDTEENTK